LDVRGEREVSVVIATRNRRASLLRSLERLVALPENPEIIVIDNASSDGTGTAVRTAFPDVRLLALEHNRGAAARNIGVEATTTSYVAFSDDDSWWQPGALARAAQLLAAYPRLGLLAARVLVGDTRRLDPVCELMAESPLTADRTLPGPPVLGFIACGAVVRRVAFLGVGGFNEQLRFTGEERLLAVDLAAAGWFCAYVPEVVAHHSPSNQRNAEARRRQAVRNELWYAWLRLSGRPAALRTWAVIRASLRDRDGRAGIVSAVAGLHTVMRHRERLPATVERAALSLDTTGWRAPVR
jgi:GT2 family glycosyltransferase